MKDQVEAAQEGQMKLNTPDLQERLRQQRVAVDVFREVLAANAISRPALRGALGQLLRELDPADPPPHRRGPQPLHRHSEVNGNLASFPCWSPVRTAGPLMQRGRALR